MPDLARFSCALCAGSDVSVVVREQGGRTIVRCLACGLECVHPLPSASELDAIYQDAGYFSGARGERNGIGYGEHYAEQPHARPVDRARLARLAKLRPERKRLLDVGCAYGGFVLAARGYGWQAKGLEVSAAAAHAAAQRWGLDVTTGTLQSAALPGGSFDAVTLWEVIEHVSNPLDDLAAVARLLRPGGVVALSTPNVKSLRARQEGPDWYGYHVSREHLYFFSAETLSRALRQAGFRIACTDTRTVDPSLRALLRRRSPAARANCGCHPGIAGPSAALRSSPVQHLLRLRTLLLQPLAKAGLGHTLEVYAVKE